MADMDIQHVDENYCCGEPGCMVCRPPGQKKSAVREEFRMYDLGPLSPGHEDGNHIDGYCNTCRMFVMFRDHKPGCPSYRPPCRDCGVKTLPSEVAAGVCDLCQQKRDHQ